MQEQAAPAEACYPREAGRLHPRCAAPNNLPGTSLPDPINQTTTPGARCPPEPLASAFARLTRSRTGAARREPRKTDANIAPGPRNHRVRRDETDIAAAAVHLQCSGVCR
jgi:hypothetical protein